METLEQHQHYRGKIEVVSKVPLETIEDLSTFYTPGVAEPCKVIAKNPEAVYDYTAKSSMVAVITDGSAVLGLGNIGARAALPVMEGKAILFKKFAGLDAFPLCLQTQDTEEIIRIITALEPSFGGINLEDIASPRCFEIEKRLQETLSIPVFHDDQHGTAVVVLAGLINALKVTGKKHEEVKIVISGAGAAGTAICKLLRAYGFSDITLCDSQGVLSQKRADLDDHKKELVTLSNPRHISGTLREALQGADIFIGVSAKNLLSSEDIRTMEEQSIVFALSNPDPEIPIEEARKGGAFIVASGRSDYPNQLNNVLVFPGMLKGAIKIRKQITQEMKLAAAVALADFVERPTPEKIIPHVFDHGVADTIANAVMNASL